MVTKTARVPALALTGLASLFWLLAPPAKPDVAIPWADQPTRASQAH